MRSMKRVFYLGMMVVVAAMLTAPFGVTLTSGGGSKVVLNTASATLKADDCIKLALPILKGASDTCNGGVKNSNGSGSAIIIYLKWILQLASGLVGTVIVLMLVWAGLGYITSTGDPGQIKTAKNRIVNAITALILFLSMFAILNFLVPGGIL
jgi:hypothetical protein